MATSFPSGLDALTNPTSSDGLNSPDHAGQHADVNDAVEALQAKVGVDGSAVTSSLDYKVAQQGLVLVGTYNIPSSPAVQYVDMLNVFSAEFDAYRVVLSGNSTFTSANLYVLLGNGGTIATAANYGYVAIFAPPYGSSGSDIFLDASSNTNKGVYIGHGGPATWASVTMFDIHNPYVTKPTTFNGHSNVIDFPVWHGGSHTVSSSYTDMRLDVDGTGTFSGGQINVYGYKLG